MWKFLIVRYRKSVVWKLGFLENEIFVTTNSYHYLRSRISLHIVAPGLRFHHILARSRNYEGQSFNIYKEVIGSCSKPHEVQDSRETLIVMAIHAHTYRGGLELCLESPFPRFLRHDISSRITCHLTVQKKNTLWKHSPQIDVDLFTQTECIKSH